MSLDDIQLLHGVRTTILNTVEMKKNIHTERSVDDKLGDIVNRFHKSSTSSLGYSSNSGSLIQKTNFNSEKKRSDHELPQYDLICLVNSEVQSNYSINDDQSISSRIRHSSVGEDLKEKLGCHDDIESLYNKVYSSSSNSMLNGENNNSEMIPKECISKELINFTCSNYCDTVGFVSQQSKFQADQEQTNTQGNNQLRKIEYEFSSFGSSFMPESLPKQTVQAELKTVHQIKDLHSSNMHYKSNELGWSDSFSSNLKTDNMHQMQIKTNYYSDYFQTQSIANPYNKVQYYYPNRNAPISPIQPYNNVHSNYYPFAMKENCYKQETLLENNNFQYQGSINLPYDNKIYVREIPYSQIKSGNEVSKQYSELNNINIMKALKDQQECRNIQNYIDKHPFISRTVLLPQLIQNFKLLCYDPFGNYLVQKIIEKIHVEDFETVTLKIAEYFLDLCLHNFGTRVVQRFIELATQPYLNCLIDPLKLSLNKLYRNQNGIHVISKFSYFSSQNQFIFDFMKINLAAICKHKEGCCMMQKILEGGLTEQKVSLYTLNLLKENYFRTNCR